MFNLTTVVWQVRQLLGSTDHAGNTYVINLLLLPSFDLNVILFTSNRFYKDLFTYDILDIGGGLVSLQIEK